MNLKMRNHVEASPPALTSMHFACTSLVSACWQVFTESSVSVYHTHMTYCSFPHSKRFVCGIRLIKSYNWLILQLVRLKSQSFLWGLGKDVLLFPPPPPPYLARNKRWLLAIDLEIDVFSSTFLYLLKQTCHTTAFTKGVPRLPVLR
jgi:hypothetical protein